MYVGVAYYPEHWPEDRWETDAKLMKEAGLTLVRMGEFAWSRMEPRRERHCFDWLQRAVSVLGKHGIKTVLGTPTASPPAWLIERHPSILPQGPDRRTKSFGARRHYCVNNVPYRKYTRRIVSQMCEAFRHNPHVLGWQIDNEFGCHDTARCYCETCANAFRDWLRRRYDTIEQLNEEWGTVFWGQEYAQWQQVPLPWATIGGDNMAHSPSLLLDFYRFCSDSHVEYQRFQANLIRSICPGHFITHNMMGLFDQLDYYDLAEDLDIVSWDNYPGSGRDPARVAAAHDLMRGVKKQHFWVMEEQAGATGWRTNTPTPRPGQLRLWTYQAVARGADALLYFRWRTCRFGTEQFWHGILGHDGAPNRRYHEVARVGQEVAEHAEEWKDTRLSNRVALVMGYDVNWALQIQPHSATFDFWSHFRMFYDTFWRMGVGVDIVRPGSDLKAYRLVIAPTLYLTGPEQRQALRTYVKGGGVLVGTFRSFVKNPYNVASDEALPAGMDDVFGLVVDEYDAVPTDAKNAIRPTAACPWSEPGHSYAINTWADVVKPKCSQTLAEYEGDFYAGAPALTVNEFGLGKAYYLGTWVERQFYSDFLAHLAQEAQVRPMTPVDAGVEVVRRESAVAEVLFYLNHRAEPFEFELAAECHDVLEGKSVSGRVSIEPYGVLILTKRI